MHAVGVVNSLCMQVHITGEGEVSPAIKESLLTAVTWARLSQGDIVRAMKVGAASSGKPQTGSHQQCHRVLWGN